MMHLFCIYICLLFLMTQFFSSNATDIVQAVASVLGRPALYLSPIGWVIDGEQNPLQNEREILQFCRNKYGQDIWTISPYTSINATIHKKCFENEPLCIPKANYTIKPWICIGNASTGKSIASQQQKLTFSVNVKESGDNVINVANIIDATEDHLKDMLASNSVSEEKARYDANMKSLQRNYGIRHEILEQKLKDAETRLSDEKWLNHPELTQNAEDDIHQEFVQKFMTLDEDKEAARKTLEDTYYRSIVELIERRSGAVVAQWDQALQTHRPNVTELTQAAQGLLHVVASNQYTKLQYYRQVMAQQPNRTDKWMKAWHQSILDLENLLHDNLLKLSKFPDIKRDIETRMRSYRQQHYSQLDKAIEDFFALTYTPKRASPQPSPRQQSLMQAKAIIEKYRHLSTQSPSGAQQRKESVDRTSFEQPHMLRVDQVETLSVIPNIPIDPNENEVHGNDGSSINPATTVKDIVQPNIDAIGAQPAISESQINGLNNIRMPILDDGRSSRPHVTSVNSYSSTAVIVTNVSVGILLLVVLFVSGRWCLKRLRRHRERAGYTLSAVEVDGHAKRGVSSGQQGDAASPRQSRLHRWQSAGYTNPAYKNTETYFPFAQAKA